MSVHRTRRQIVGASLAAALFAPILAAALTGSPAVAQAITRGDGMIHQLRIYEIFEPNKAAFHARFRDHAARIMRKYDFQIVAMWEAKSAERTEFVYVLAWPDQATLDDRWAKFMADPEWADIKQRTAAEDGQLVGEIQSRVLRLTDYSPRID